MYKVLENLAGKVFGQLTVIERAENRGGRAHWLCKCECGNNPIVSAKMLKSGRTKSCGCLRRNGKDVSGQRFGRLVALHATDKRQGTAIVWLCQCDCGKTCETRLSSLLDGNTRSCGCLVEENGSSSANQKHNIENTRIPTLLHANTVYKSNTSGIRGVSWNKKYRQWETYIKFKGRQYRLGLYNDLDKAAAVRKKAENLLYGEFLDWYYDYIKTQEQDG